MKLKYRLAIVALAILVVSAYAVHSQITPKPLTPFVVNSVMSSPLANGKTLTENFSTAVRYDGSWVEIRAVHAGGKNWQERDIHDFNLATLTIVEDMTKSTVTTVIVPHDITKWRLLNTGSCEGKSTICTYGDIPDSLPRVAFCCACCVPVISNSSPVSMIRLARSRSSRTNGA